MIVVFTDVHHDCGLHDCGLHRCSHDCGLHRCSLHDCGLHVHYMIVVYRCS